MSEKGGFAPMVGCKAPEEMLFPDGVWRYQLWMKNNWTNIYIYIYIWKSLKSLIKSILNIYTEKKGREKLAGLFFRSVSLHFNEDIILTSQIHGETGAALKEHHVGKGICVSPSWQQLATSGFSAEPSNEKYYNMNHMSLYDVIQCKQNLPFLP